MSTIDVSLRVIFDLINEIKIVYDDIQRNKRLLKNLKNYTESIQYFINQINNLQHKITFQQSIEESLARLRIATTY